MEDKKTGNKKLIVIIGIIAALVCIVVGGIGFNHVFKEVSFSENEELYFKMFVDTFDEGGYEFYSLDAYYFMDTGMIYYNGKYKAYIEIEDKWYDVDEVVYGSKGLIYNKYCRSWDQLYGFEGIDEDFERAKEEGIHKEYTLEEIEELLEEAYKAKK